MLKMKKVTSSCSPMSPCRLIRLRKLTCWNYNIAKKEVQGIFLFLIGEGKR